MEELNEIFNKFPNYIKLNYLNFKPEKPKILKDIEYISCGFNENNFYKSKIINCKFIDCNLSESNFSKAELKYCEFINCDFTFCSMLKINISNCLFIDCNFHHSNLCHSILIDNSFYNCILKALYKEPIWNRNIFDDETIIESCGGEHCFITKDILEIISKSNKINIK